MSEQMMKALIAQTERADKLAEKLKRATQHVVKFKRVANFEQHKCRQLEAKCEQLERQNVATWVSTEVAPDVAFRMTDWADAKAEFDRLNAQLARVRTQNYNLMEEVSTQEVALANAKTEWKRVTAALEQMRDERDGWKQATRRWEDAHKATMELGDDAPMKLKSQLAEALGNVRRLVAIEVSLSKQLGEACIERDSAIKRIHSMEWMDSAIDNDAELVVISASEYRAMAESHDAVEGGERVLLSNDAYNDMMADLDRLGPLEERVAELLELIDVTNTEYNDLRVKLDDAEVNVAASRFSAETHAAAATKARDGRDHKQVLLENAMDQVRQLTEEIRATENGVKVLHQRHAEQLNRLADQFAEIARNQAAALAGVAGR